MTELILSALTAAVLVVGGFAAKALDKFAATNADQQDRQGDCLRCGRRCGAGEPDLCGWAQGCWQL